MTLYLIIQVTKLTITRTTVSSGNVGFLVDVQENSDILEIQII